MAEERKATQPPEAVAVPSVPSRSLLKEAIPPTVAILPLRNSVFFPGGVLPLSLGRQKSIALMKDAIRDGALIGLVTQRRMEEEAPTAKDFYAMGTAGRIVKMRRRGEEDYAVVIRGLARCRVLDLVQESPYLKARVEAVEDTAAANPVELEALGTSLKRLAREVLELMPGVPPRAFEAVESIDDAGHLADFIAANLEIPIAEKQAVLETVDVETRTNLVLKVLTRTREALQR